MGSNLVRLTDKTYMTELEERIRGVNEEGLNKRIASRVLDEMERLKRLILVGKTPLAECPPELYNHPVFVFWRMVNREVAMASKKRANAYYRKLRASQRSEQGLDEESEGEDKAEEGEQLTPEQLMAKFNEDLQEQKRIAIDKGTRFTDEHFAHPRVRARLEKHMGSNLVRLTDKTYMTELEERIRGVNEEGLNKRIASRV
ncbi:Uncharacterized protein OBRU01_22937, partial [Operophtera brumata]